MNPDVLRKLINEMRSVGTVSLLFGGLQCLSIVGAVIGIPLIISGLRLRESADKMEGYINSNDQKMFEDALVKQTSFFFIQKILFIVGLAVVGLYLVTMLVLILSFASEGWR
jgi:hypothetical protein